MNQSTETFHFERDFPLSAARMWHLMTDPKMRESWGAPGDAVLEMISSDMQVGGVDQHRCGPADDPEFSVETRWYHLEAPDTATFTEVIEAGGMRLGASLVTYALANNDSGCNVSITVAVTSFVGPEMIAEFNNGWTSGFEQLAVLANAQNQE